jgi:hypothetical protein
MDGLALVVVDSDDYRHWNAVTKRNWRLANVHVDAFAVVLSAIWRVVDV